MLVMAGHFDVVDHHFTLYLQIIEHLNVFQLKKQYSSLISLNSDLFANKFPTIIDT